MWALEDWGTWGYEPGAVQLILPGMESYIRDWRDDPRLAKRKLEISEADIWLTRNDQRG